MQLPKRLCCGPCQQDSLHHSGELSLASWAVLLWHCCLSNSQAQHAAMEAGIA